MDLNSPPLAAAPHDHIVELYASDDELIDHVAEWLADGLERGAGSIVIATRPHAEAFRERLGAGAGIVVVDAAELLADLLVDGRPNRDRAFEACGGLISDMAGERPVRVYGEMVQLLAERGDTIGAVELEEIWNELGRELDFLLYCAYRQDTVSATRSGQLAAICDTHSRLVGTPPEAPTDDLQLTHVATGRFAPEPGAPRSARRFVAGALDEWGWAGNRAVAELITTELASNAIVHARSEFHVMVARTDDIVRIAVADMHPTPPSPGPISMRARSGRGLQMVANLATTWGHKNSEVGKVIWADILV